MAGIYIHIPFCKQACYYCNFHFSTKKNYKILIKSIEKEVFLKKTFLKNEKIESIYFGGGTPSLIKSSSIKKIIDAINENYIIKPECEITLEANPDDITEEILQQWKMIGINRISIGIQSFNDTILKIMNRSHDSIKGKDALEKIQKYFDNYSMDLIYGSPKSTINSIKKDLKFIEKINPPHVSIYNMTIEKKTVFYNLKKLGKLKFPNTSRVLNQYKTIQNFMKNNKYINYEISNFCKNDLISIHNSNYWKSRKYIGFGPSAHSYDLNKRYWNSSNNEDYIESINNNIIPQSKEILSKKNKINEYIMTRIRTIWGVNLKKLKNEYEIDLYHLKKKELDFFEKKNHIKIKNNSIYLNEEGKMISDHITEKLIL